MTEVAIVLTPEDADVLRQTAEELVKFDAGCFGAGCCCAIRAPPRRLGEAHPPEGLPRSDRP